MPTKKSVRRQVKKTGKSPRKIRTPRSPASVKPPASPPGMRAAPAVSYPPVVRNDVAVMATLERIKRAASTPRPSFETWPPAVPMSKTDTNPKIPLVRSDLACNTVPFGSSYVSVPTRDLKLAYIMIRTLPDKSQSPPRFKPKDTSRRNMKVYCTERKWTPTSGCSSTYLSRIPYLDMLMDSNGEVRYKQYALGRMRNLEAYYHCPDLFITLDSDDWDSQYKVNDLFIYCAQEGFGAHPLFPIRIVTSSVGLADTDRRLGMRGWFNPGNPMSSVVKPVYPTILTREICQITQYFGMYLYQSINNPTIIFASKRSPIDKHMLDALSHYRLTPVRVE